MIQTILGVIFEGVRSTSKAFQLDMIDWLKVARQLGMYAVAVLSVAWAEKQFHPLMWKIALGVAIVEVGRRFVVSNDPKP